MSLIFLIKYVSSFCNEVKASFFLKYEKRPLSPSKRLKKKYRTRNVEINKK